MANKNTHSTFTLKLDDTRLWIGFLLILLAVANILVFYVYQQAYPTQTLPNQIWEYLKSDPFKAVTISIVLPIILFLLERLFEIRKTHKERWVKEKEAGVEKRGKCIEQTAKSWNNYQGLMHELALFEKGSTKKPNYEAQAEKQSITDLSKRMVGQYNELKELINAWYFWFPNVRRMHQEEYCKLYDITHYVDVLAHCFNTVAYFIDNSNDETEIKELQGCLSVISHEIEDVVHHPLLLILKNSLEIWKTEGDDSPEAQTSRVAAEKEIECFLEVLVENAQELRVIEFNNYKFLPALVDEKGGKVLRDAHKKLESNLSSKYAQSKDHDKLKKDLKSSSDWKKFEAALDQIDCRDLIQGKKIFYSPDLVRELAKWFLKDAALREVCRRVKKQSDDAGSERREKRSK